MQFLSLSNTDRLILPGDSTISSGAGSIRDLVVGLQEAAKSSKARGGMGIALNAVLVIFKLLSMYDQVGGYIEGCMLATCFQPSLPTL